MKIKFKLFVITLLMFLGINMSFAADWQYWSTLSAVHNISEREQVSMLTELYFADGLSQNYVYDEYISYSRKIGSWFNLLGQTYFESVRQPNSKWTGTRSIVAGLSYTKDIHFFIIKAETRFFYKLTSPSQWDYYRPRIYIIKNIGRVSLSISDEMRVDLTDKRISNFYRNRFYATVSIKVSQVVTLGAGYLSQSDKIEDGWKSFNGVQTLINIYF
jgi:hypothetical protein